MRGRAIIFIYSLVALTMTMANVCENEILECDTISLRSWHGKYVVAEANGQANANRDNAGKIGKWKIVPKSGGKFALKGNFGKHLAAEKSGGANANRPWASTWETFEGIPIAGNYFGLKTHHNTYLVAENDGSLNADSDEIGPSERFEVICNSPNLCARLYKNHLATKDDGESLEVTDAAVENNYDGTNAPDGWDNEVNSFDVQPDCELTGYENEGKNGHMFSFATGSYEAPKENTMSSWICTCDPEPTSSTDTTANLCAILYKNHLASRNEGEFLDVLNAAADDDYEGTNAPDGWDNEVSSFHVRPGCELTGYENQNKNGHMFSFAEGSYEAPKDDTMSSWICTCF